MTPLLPISLTMLCSLALPDGPLAVTSAGAAEARASGNVPVRDRPRSSAAVIDNLRDGAFYEVEDCTRQARWCLVSEPAPAEAGGYVLGWVRGSSLVGSAAKNRVTPFEFLVDPFRDDD